MASSDSDEFELIDSLDIAKQIVSEKKPDLHKIRLWLNPTDYTASSSEYQRHLSSQAPGTGEWIRETTQFKQWHSSGDHGSIWIKAVPGAGKSAVAASMVDSLARNESFPTLYFFFRQIIEANQTSRSLLRDWLAQLLLSSEILQVSLWELVEEKKNLETISTEQLWKLLLSALRSTDKVYCIVDALDEMTLDEDFLGRLNAMGSFRPAHVKILMTSRPKQYLQRAMKDPQVIHVSLEEELVKRDISVFVHQRVSRLSHLGHDAQDFIESTVCDRSQGLFLYARLILDQLARSIEADRLDEASVRNMVAKLPIGLEQMYNRMLFEHASVSEVNQRIQILILQLVTQSARPLRLIEIAKAVEVSHGAAAVDIKDTVRTACGPLLEIMEDEVVQILHHSFTEFLLDTGRLNSAMTQFPVIDPATAHRSIAMTCLAHLQGDALQEYPSNRHSDDEELYSNPRSNARFNFRAIFLQYPLVEYAARKWTYHAKQYDFDDPTIFTAVEHFCDLEKPWFNAWLSFMSERDVAALAAKDVTPLHVAASFGLTHWTKYLLKNGAKVDARDSTENSPLFWASKFGHADVVKYLLKARAKPDIDGYNGLKPLHVAASRNHSEVVKLLLAAGVSPTTPKPREFVRRCGNARASIGHHPLMYACQRGHVETVVEMIPHITKVEDLEDGLCWAARGGHSQLILALLDMSTVSPNARLHVRHKSVSVTSGGHTALILAAKSLDPACVRVLLDKGADVHASSSRDLNDGFWSFSDRHYQRRPQATTALHSLAKAKFNVDSETAAKQIFDLLLAAGADLEARDCCGNTPLLSTIGDRHSHGSSTSILDMLLTAGASPLAVDDTGETLLHKSCRASINTDIAKKLLELNVNPSQRRTSDGATALHCAVANIHCAADMIQLLVGHGADVNAQDSEGNSALHRACKEGSIKEMVTLEALLSLGADVNLQNILGQTCLFYFRLCTGSHNNNEDRFKQIIEVGANLELTDREGKTLLLHTVADSNEVVLDAFLRHANPSLTARTFRHGKTVLHLACYSRNAPRLVQKLVDHGADPTWTDNDGNTLLHEAAALFEGFPEDVALVDKLIELGVPIHARNCLRRTALHVVGPLFASNGSVRETPSRQSIVSVLRRHDPIVDLDAKDIDGYTPLHLTAAASEVQTFNLLQAGALPSARAFNLRTPLHCAARARQSGIIAMILRFALEGPNPIQSFDINAKDEDGLTPLRDACRSGRPESVRILLDAGVDVHQEDNNHASPLRACAEFVDEEKLWTCLKKGTAAPDEFRPVRAFRGSWLYARQDDPQNDTARIGPIASMLLEAGVSDEGALRAASAAGSSELVEALRRDEPPANEVDSTESEGEPDDADIGQLATLGNTEKMNKHIDRAKLLDDPTSDLQPLLQRACDRPVWNVDMLKLLVSRGQVDVNAHHQVKEKVGYRKTGKIVPGPTALHVLAKGNYWWQVEAIKFLVDNGAEVDSLDDNGQTPLEIASTYIRYSSSRSQGYFRPQCCDMLLKLGANPNRVNSKGLVPLNLAGSDADIIKVLLRHGAEVNIGTKGVLMSAVEAGDVETLKIYLENGADCNVPDSSSDSSYQTRLDGSMTHKYPLLTAASPPPYGAWDNSTTTKMIDLLLEHGAKVDLRVSDTETILHSLFRTRPTSILRPFLEKPEMDFNIRDQKGRTVFMAACKSQVEYETSRSTHYISREELDALKAEYTPAYMAMADSERHAASIDYLARDNKGKHIVHYLQPKWSDKVADRFLSVPGVRALIRKKDTAGFSPLHGALKGRKMKTCFQFIDEGKGDLVEPDPNGDTALHHLYRSHCMSDLITYRPLMQRYLELGGDINARNKSGETALHALIAKLHPAARYDPTIKDKEDGYDPIQFFIIHGANFQAVKNDGETALHVVAQRQAQVSSLDMSEDNITNAGMFRKLVDLGCDPLQEDNMGRTALDVAAAVGNKGILGLYQRKKA